MVCGRIKLMKDDDSLRKIANAVKLIGGKKLILFGSQARGKGNKDSDLDLCVVVREGDNPLAVQKKLRLKLWDTGYNWQWPLDLHVFSESVYKKRLLEGDPFVSEIGKGVVLYE